MFKKKCPDCGEKVERKFNFCPFCGSSFKKKKNEDNYGMLGTDDIINLQETKNEIKLPMGLDKIMGGLMKQLNKELGTMTKGDNLSVNGMPRGFSIQISTGRPQIKKTAPQQNKPKREVIRISAEELKRRNKLPRKEAQSSIRRIGDIIIYEVITPGVNSREQIIIAKLEEGIEIRAYSKDKCYYKVIPLKVEIKKWYVLDGRVVLEFQG